MRSQHIREQSNEIQEQINYDIQWLSKIRNGQNKDHVITGKNVELVSIANSRDKHISMREKDNKL